MLQILTFFVPGYKVCFPNPLCLKQIEDRAVVPQKLCFCDQGNDNFKFVGFEKILNSHSILSILLKYS